MGAATVLGEGELKQAGWIGAVSLEVQLVRSDSAGLGVGRQGWVRGCDG